MKVKEPVTKSPPEEFDRYRKRNWSRVHSDRRIAQATITKKLKTFAKVVAYVRDQLGKEERHGLTGALLTRRKDYALAGGADAGFVRLKCANEDHPAWKVSTECLLGRRSWCGHCRRSVKKTPQQVEKELVLRGLRLLSRYENANAPITIGCINGHTSTATLSKIVNSHSGCPLCHGSREEAIVRHYLEHLLGLKSDQVRKRPAWLKAISGKALELDGFCSSEKIAFEYQGYQHTKQAGFTGGNMRAIQARDALKSEACKRAGVRLLIIEHLRRNWTDAQVAAHVMRSILRAKMHPVCPVEHVPRFIRSEPGKLEALRLAVAQKDGILRADVYRGYHSPHLIQCSAGHEWGGSPASIFRGCWCPECGRKKTSQALREALRRRQQVLKAQKQGIICSTVEARGGRLLDSDQDGPNCYRVQCLRCGHHWNTSGASLMAGHFCRKCHIQKLIAAGRKAAAARRKVPSGILLSASSAQD